MTQLLDSPRKTFKQLCDEAAATGKIGKRAAKLAWCAEMNNLRVADLTRFPELLDKIDFEPEEVTPRLRSEAQAIISSHNVTLENWKEWWNKTFHPEPERPDWRNDPNGKLDAGNFQAQHIKLDVGKRSKIYGHPVTAVLRWMGQEDWTKADAKKALRKLGIDIADSTVDIQLRAGQRGERGDPASLTKQQENDLWNLLEE
jgi:hypothetical protein